MAAVPSPPDGPPRLRIAAVSLGVTHACAIAKDDGGVWCWGIIENWDPSAPATQESRKTPTFSAVPARVEGLDQVTQLSTGDMQTWALRADGSLWGWGGPLGERPKRLSDAQVVGLAEHASAWIDAEHRLVVEGSNARGRLGVGSPTARRKRAPEQVTRRKVPNLPPVRGASLGEFSGCALSLAGEVYCWGWGYSCEGPTRQTVSDAPVLKLFGASDSYCVIDAASQVRCNPPPTRDSIAHGSCEGLDPSGSLSPSQALAIVREDDAAARRAQPQQAWKLVGTGTVAALGLNPYDSERYAACLADAEHGAACWSDSPNHPFGILSGDAVSRIEEKRRFTQLSMSEWAACGVTEQARLECWGTNFFGQFGDASDRATTRLVPNEPSFPSAADHAH